jgi:DNA adenine methylase
MIIKPVLKYPGAKWRLAPWITQHIPDHGTYLEPYCGSAAVFFCKQPASHEILNDRFGSIVNLFNVLRTQGEDLARLIDLTPWSRDEYLECERQFTGTGDALEDARRFLVRCWQAHGTRFNKSSGWRNVGSGADARTTPVWRQLPARLYAVIDRLKMAEIENRPAVEVIRRYNTADCLIYADPPYVLDTRHGKYYEYEMTDDEHIELLQALDEHRGPVLLSGYAHSLYDERLRHWRRITVPVIAEKGKHRTEVLWLNARAAQTQQLSFEFVEELA